MATPRKGFLLRVPESLLDELRALADAEMRSLNAQIEWLLRDALRQRGRRVDKVDPATGGSDPEGRTPGRDS